MSSEDAKSFVAHMLGLLKRMNINPNQFIININLDKATGIAYNGEQPKAETQETTLSDNTDELVGKALCSIVGEGKPIDCKQKWAGAYWYLRWAYNFPIDVQDFCKRIEDLLLPIENDYCCCYENIRKLTTLSFMNEDPRQMDKVRPSKMDTQIFFQCREVALKLDEELGKMR